MEIVSAGLSDVGCVRSRNEDSYFVDPGLGLYVVADGMGGHAAGDVASQLCVDTVLEHLRGEHTVSLSSSPTAELHRRLRQAINRASQAIQDEARRKPFLYGMGTTVVVLALAGERAVLAHAGDSRAYLITSEGLERLTSDHTWVNEQVQNGLLTEAEGEASQYKNLLTRSVGFDARVESDTTERPIRPGDRFLLCSDGLTNVVSDDELWEIVNKYPEPKEAGEYFVSLARDRGAPDNVTAVLLYVSE